MITLTPNPSCLCGCGNEVSKPDHRFVLGHVRRRKMTDEQVADAIDMRKRGISTYRIAEKFGVSQTWICYIDSAKKQGAIPDTAGDTVRYEQIEIRRLIRAISKYGKGCTTDSGNRIEPKEYLIICRMIDDGYKPAFIARQVGRTAETIRKLKYKYLKEKGNNEKSGK